MSKRAPYPLLPAAPGEKQYWRSLEELAQTPAFQEFVQREFPAGASELSSPISRRNFMNLMGASFALAGMSACRRPQEKILPYTKAPEHGTLGLPTNYATTLSLGPESVGVLVESNDGRPTKIEGNPQHPMSAGASSSFLQAAILDLYDPDRSTHPVVAGKGYKDGEREKGYEAAVIFLRERQGRFQASQGAGLHVLSGALVSPTMLRLRDELLLAMPKARWHLWEPVCDDALRAGSRLAFSDDLHAHYRLDKAEIILALDADPLGMDPDSLRMSQAFSSRRRPEDRDDTMNRLYVVEPSWTVSGATSDHRLRLRAAEIGPFALQLAAELHAQGLQLPPEISAALPKGKANADRARFLSALAKDLQKNAGKAVILVGRNQPREVHALCHGLNSALGAGGKTVHYTKQIDAGRPLDGESMKDLHKALEGGAVDTLVVLGGNPVYDAPADLDLAAKLKGGKAALVHLGLHFDETAEAAQVHLPRAHALESWGDARATDGTVSVVQPLIAPLFGGLSDLELVHLLLHGKLRSGYELVRETWRMAQAPAPTQAPDGKAATPAAAALAAAAPAPAPAATPAATPAPAAAPAPVAAAAPSPLELLFEGSWRKILRDGLLIGSAVPPVTPTLQPAAIGASLASIKPAAEGLEIVFAPSSSTYDGRFANNGWLQELPDAITKLTWDNAALLSARTARELGVDTDDMVRLTVRGKSVEAAVFVQPGQADKVVTLALGYGRRMTGRIGKGAGFDAYKVRDSSALGFDAVQIQKTGAKYDDPRDLTSFDADNVRDGTWIDWVRRTGLVPAQDHFSQSEDEKWNANRSYGKHEHKAEDKAGHDAKGADGRPGLTHTSDHHAVEGRPLVREANLPEFRKEPSFAKHAVHHPPLKSLWEERPYVGQQWGMTIDLSACTGCGACTLACQAENNIPIVGKAQVRKGREMHWIRVDRYFSGSIDDPEAAVQPVPCQQCENAPCENVCPVAATVHSEDGLNDMIYNRCVGTRYCSNNCPYKVRRFNYLDYRHYYERDEKDDVLPIARLKYNPDVTLRSRGVIEKCTYCVQRIRGAQRDAKLKGQDRVADGVITPACAQACPSEAIVFGDITDPNSRVAQLKKSPRNYEILAEINTKPRTSYLARIRNQNPELRDHE